MSASCPKDAVSTGHVVALDGVRGLAVLAVLVHHLTFIAPTAGAGLWLVRLAHAGWLGVDLFFVLSGFLITGILVRARPSPRYYTAFYARRVLRIFPLYYLILVALLAAAWWLPSLPGHREQFLSDQPYYWLFAANHIFARVGGGMALNTAPFWSLAVEEQFYFVWPFLVRAVRPTRLPWIASGVVLAAFVGRTLLVVTGTWPAIAIYSTTLTRLDGLGIGALLALALATAKGRVAVARWTPYALGLSLSVLVAVCWSAGWRADENSLGMQTIGFTVAALTAACAVSLAVTAAPGRRLARHLASRPLLACGRHSYAMYLLHGPLMYYAARAGFTYARCGAWTGSWVLGQLLYLGVIGGTVYVAAVLAWHLLESRAMAYKGRFPY